jgi:hypothetical protein
VAALSASGTSSQGIPAETEPIASQYVPLVWPLFHFPARAGLTTNGPKFVGSNSFAMPHKTGRWSVAPRMWGDPWCIIYDQHQQSIILHIARIDRQYVVVWPREQRSTKSTIMAVAIDIAVEGLKSYERRAS